jgi:hypothetical protein
MPNAENVELTVIAPSSRPLTSDPVQALRGLTDLQYRFMLDAAQVAALVDIAVGSRDIASPGAWRECYGRAITVAEQILSDVDRRIETQQQSLSTMEDPLDARNRLATAPRRAAEKAVGEVRTQLQRSAKTWLDRLTRQQELAMDGCAPWFRDSVKWSEKRDRHGITMELDSQWWQQLEQFVRSTCANWQANVTKGVDADSSSIVSDWATRSVGINRSLPPIVDSLAVPDARVRFDVPMLAREIEVPGRWMVVLRSSRGMAMTVIGPFASLLPHFVPRGDNGSSSLPQVIAGLTAAAMVISMFVAFSDVEHQQRLLYERALQQWKDTAHQQARIAVTAALDRQRRALERWVEMRVEQWTRAVDAWFATNIEPQLTAFDTSAQDYARQLKLQQARMQEELSTQRSLRSQLGQNILPELRRRFHELASSAALSDGRA